MVLDGLMPVDEKLRVLGASSDHTIVNLTHSDKDYKLGDVVKFRLSYGALLAAFTSKYVDRVYE